MLTQYINRIHSFFILSLTSMNTYALNPYEVRVDDRIETVITALPWLILFFIALNSFNRKQSERFHNVLTVLFLAVGGAAIAWVFGYIEC